MFELSLLISFLTSAAEFLNGDRWSVIIPYALVVPIFLCLPRFVFVPYLRPAVNGSWLEKVELSLFSILILNAPASLWFHKMGFQYDRFLHAFSALFVFLIAVLVFIAWKQKNNRIVTAKNSTLPILFVGVLCLFLWEGFQFSSDQIFGTYLFADAVQDIYVDFWEDILFGSFGLFGGYFYARFYFQRFLGVLEKRTHKA